MVEQSPNRFFGRVRNYFKAKYAGRYFAVILAELAHSAPKAFAAIIHNAFPKLLSEHFRALRAGELTVDLEWRFPKRKGKKQRIADLAVYTEPENPILIIEVKDEDGRTKANVDQLQDYVTFVRMHNKKTNSEVRQTRFLLLSRYVPRLEDEQELKKASPKGAVENRRHGQIPSILSRMTGDPLVRMVCEYLEDAGMTYQQINLNRDPDRKALQYLCYQAFEKNVGPMTGGATAIPQLMNKFFGNLEILGNWVHEHNGRKIFPQRFKRHFDIDYSYSLPARSSKKLFNLKGKRKNGEDRFTKLLLNEVNEHATNAWGELCFYAQGYFRDGGGVHFGYYYGLEQKRRHAEPNFGMYAQFWWPGYRKTCEPEDLEFAEPLRSSTTDALDEKALRSCLKKAQSIAIKKAPARYRKVLGNFSPPGT
jgi:hypothetical protein